MEYEISDESPPELLQAGEPFKPQRDPDAQHRRAIRIPEESPVLLGQSARDSS